MDLMGLPNDENSAALQDKEHSIMQIEKQNGKNKYVIIQSTLEYNSRLAISSTVYIGIHGQTLKSVHQGKQQPQ